MNAITLLKSDDVIRTALYLLYRTTRVAMTFHHLIGFYASMAAPPTPAMVQELTRQYALESAIETWQVERNPIATDSIRARNVADFDQPILGIELCGFARPVFGLSADKIVVDMNQFSDLRCVRGRDAQRLEKNGIRLGRLVAKHDSRQVVKLLVTSGVIDANIHVAATILLMEEGRDRFGYWARLVSDDRYWTNQENRVQYDFAVRIAANGDIDLMNPAQVGDTPTPP